MEHIGTLEKDTALALRLPREHRSPMLPQAQVSRTTIYRKLEDPEFHRQVCEFRDKLISTALGRMADKMTRAADELTALLDAPEAHIRMRAIRTLFSLAIRMRDSIDVTARMRAVENELGANRGCPMSNVHRISGLMRSVMGLPVDVPTHAAAGNDTDALARELSAQFIEDLRKYRDARDGDLAIFEPGDMRFEQMHSAIKDKSPDKVTFQEIEVLSRDHPEEALARWEEVKSTARHDLTNGWQAARGVSFDAWGRACYLAIRDQLRETWPPRSGVEAMLLDEMAQYEFLRRGLVHDFSLGSWKCDSKTSKQYLATAELGRAVDRLQRLFQYALRTLLMLRRKDAPPIVQRVVTANIDTEESATPCALNE